MKIWTELIITTNGVERTKTYDKADRVTSATDSWGGKVTETNFVYDPINQLLNEALPNGTSKSYTLESQVFIGLGKLIT